MSVASARHRLSHRQGPMGADDRHLLAIHEGDVRQRHVAGVGRPVVQVTVSLARMEGPGAVSAPWPREYLSRSMLGSELKQWQGSLTDTGVGPPGEWLSRCRCCVRPDHRRAGQDACHRLVGDQAGLGTKGSPLEVIGDRYVQWHVVGVGSSLGSLIVFHAREKRAQTQGEHGSGRDREGSHSSGPPQQGTNTCL
jgi:hypothetical protein